MTACRDDRPHLHVPHRARRAAAGPTSCARRRGRAGGRCAEARVHRRSPQLAIGLAAPGRRPRRSVHVERGDAHIPLQHRRHRQDRRLRNVDEHPLHALRRRCDRPGCGLLDRRRGLRHGRLPEGRPAAGRPPARRRGRRRHGERSADRASDVLRRPRQRRAVRRQGHRHVLRRGRQRQHRRPRRRCRAGGLRHRVRHRHHRRSRQPHLVRGDRGRRRRRRRAPAGRLRRHQADDPAGRPRRPRQRDRRGLLGRRLDQPRPRRRRHPPAAGLRRHQRRHQARPAGGHRQRDRRELRHADRPVPAAERLGQQHVDARRAPDAQPDARREGLPARHPHHRALRGLAPLPARHQASAACATRAAR